MTAVEGTVVPLPFGDHPVSGCHSDSPMCVGIITEVREVVDKFNRDRKAGLV